MRMFFGVMLVAVVMHVAGFAAHAQDTDPEPVEVCVGFGTFELPLITAGDGEALALELIAGLPIPVPRPVRELPNRFAQIAQGLLETRSQTLRGLAAAAHAQQQLLHLVEQNGEAIDRVAALPLPIPHPELADLRLLNTDLIFQVGASRSLSLNPWLIKGSDASHRRRVK